PDAVWQMAALAHAPVRRHADHPRSWSFDRSQGRSFYVGVRYLLFLLRELLVPLLRVDLLVLLRLVLLLLDLRAAVLRLLDLRVFVLAALFFLAGTLAPALRASERPIAIACLRLFTVLPERPLLSVPRFFSCIAFFTLLFAFGPYLAVMCSLLHAFVEDGHSRRVPGCPPSVSV